ncbi:MAG: acyl-CoA synthetase [Pseudomonadota bacterium]
MVLLPKADDYDGLVAGFAWDIPTDLNIAAMCCDRWAVRAPERPAILSVDPDGGITETRFGALRSRTDRLANGLKAMGVARGDRVAILLPQCPETAISHLAIYKLGAIAVPMALLFGPDALEYRLEDSGAAALITCQAGLDKLSQMVESPPSLKHILSIDGPGDHGALSFHEVLDRAQATFTNAITGPDTPAMMIYTSGTTGPPKGALHGHRVLTGHLPGVQMPHEFFPMPGDLMWTPADWAWAGGLLNVLLPSLWFGVPVVAHRADKFDPEHAFRLCADLGVRNTFIPPTALRLMRTVERPSARYDLSIRTVGSGGESLGRETYDWGRTELGVTINEFYGQTECNLVLSSCAAIGVSRPGAIGRPVPGHTVAVIDTNGQVLPPGETGQIAVKRPDPVMFLEYWNRPEATEAKFIGDWMTTGDEGHTDGEGYVFFVGRDDDVITSAGYRIGPGEIEDCLLGHPAVRLAAVIGKPDPIRTEIVKAFIVPRDDVASDDALAADIQDYVRTRLAAYEYPREITFVDSLPMTTTGKIIRRLLRDSG